MLASLSVDLDNLWAYQMVHGDPSWDRYASYLELVVPRMLEVFARIDAPITVFVVGRDAADPRNHDVLRTIVDAGHELGNHSHDHLPWMHRLDRAGIDEQLTAAHQAIVAATGVAPTGFRGPGYSLGPEIVRSLRSLGYAYDASLLPTWVGPFARAYYLRGTDLTAEQRHQRRELFGHLRDASAPVHPFRWVDATDPGGSGTGGLVELPVTVLPVARVPFHPSYLLYLAGRSPALATAYFRAGLRLCRLRRVEPSLLFHPLDLLGPEDAAGLGFFPAMGLSAARKIDLVNRWLDLLRRSFEPVTLADHVAALAARDLPERPLDATATTTTPRPTRVSA